MESLQQAWNDLVRRLRELPGRTQILIATVTVLCVAIFVLFNQSGDHNSEVNLLPGTSLTVRQLSTYQIAFADAGLAEYRIEKQKIFVLKTKKADFMAALSKANLLTAASGKYLEKALDSSSPFENQQQRKQIQRLLGQTTSPDVAEQLWDQREELLTNGRFEGRQIPVTILFADTCNFTKVAESMNPWVDE